MERLTGRLGQVMAVKTAMEAEDVEVFVYGMELIVSTLINAMIIISTGALIGLFAETLLFYCVFSAFQSICGGFHASTHFRCFCVTFSGWAVGMVVNLYATLPLLLVLAALGIFFVFTLAPIEHINAPMNTTKRMRMRKYARRMSIAAVCTVILLYAIDNSLYATMLTAMGAVGISMTAASLRKRLAE